MSSALYWLAVSCPCCAIPNDQDERIAKRLSSDWQHVCAERPTPNAHAPLRHRSAPDPASAPDPGSSHCTHTPSQTSVSDCRQDDKRSESAALTSCGRPCQRRCRAPCPAGGQSSATGSTADNKKHDALASTPVAKRSEPRTSEGPSGGRCQLRPRPISCHAAQRPH